MTPRLARRPADKLSASAEAASLAGAGDGHRFADPGSARSCSPASSLTCGPPRTPTRSWPGPRPTSTGSPRRSPGSRPTSAGRRARCSAGLGADAPDEATILAFCAQALAAQTAFVRDHDLVTVYDDPVELIDLPEINRGVAVAYCDPPGPQQAPAAADVHRGPRRRRRPAGRPGRRRSAAGTTGTWCLLGVVPRRGSAGPPAAARARPPVRGLDPGQGPRSGRARSSRAGRSTRRN